MVGCFGTSTGDTFDRFVFNSNGTVSGYNSNGASGGQSSFGQGAPSATPMDLPQACCDALGFTYEPAVAKCYYTQDCDTTEPFKIVFGSNQNDGALFQIDDGETCQLEINFDYLISYDCTLIQTCVDELITKVTDELSIVTNEYSAISNSIIGIQYQLDGALLLPNQTDPLLILQIAAYQTNITQLTIDKAAK
jgi:hypothetical protein